MNSGCVKGAGVDLSQDPALVIIGSGLAGYQTAKHWRMKDRTTPLVIITEDDGAFYSKPQLSTALAHKKTPEQLVLKTAQHMADDLQATIYTHTQVSALKPKERVAELADGIAISYRDCVLATGARMLQLPIKNEAKDKMFGVNSLADYQKLYAALQAKPGARVAIIGSGLVGCELSNDMVQAGYHVNVITLDAWPMQRFIPEALGRHMQHAFAEHGIHWHLKTTVSDLQVQPDGKQVLECDGPEKLAFEADIVISAIGFAPNTQLAQQAGLKIESGIDINQQLQTSNAHIYALGDCAALQGVWRPYIAPIMHASKVLAQVLAGDDQVKVDYPIMPVVAKTPLCRMLRVFLDPSHLDGMRVAIEDDQQGAKYYNDQNMWVGFALCGQAAASQRALWLKELQQIK